MYDDSSIVSAPQKEEPPPEGPGASLLPSEKEENLVCGYCGLRIKENGQQRWIFQYNLKKTNYLGVDQILC